MKTISCLFIITALLIGCSSPEKLLQQGNYDALVEKSVKNLIKNPGSEEDATMLEKSYKLANERDLDRIKYLKTEGNPDTWDEMLSCYSNLKNRQASVKRVLPLHAGGKTIMFETVDYDAEIVAAKRKAAEYFYSHGLALMESNTKDAYRQAYYELNKARTYSGDSYRDLDQVIGKAKYLGMSRALVSVVNRTIINLPEAFTEGLIAVNATDLNSEWVEYYTRKPDSEIQYDYYVDIILQNISVSPDLVQDKDLIEKKTIENGFDYVLDSRGNVMKDSLGNDIKVKKYKDIQCTVIESYQMKECNITGEIEFHASQPQSLLKKQPVAASTRFEHLSARAIGDLNALSPEKRKLVDLDPIPFPNDIAMILDCTEALKRSIYEVLHYNRNIIR